MHEESAIVCVEDDAIILLSLKQELARHFSAGYRLEVSADAQEALDLVERLYAEKTRVALVLTDWLMPGLKGDELILRVKKRHPEVRCILISGQADAQAVANARLNPLLDAFIQKPWRSDSLIQSVRRAVEYFSSSDPDWSGELRLDP